MKKYKDFVKLLTISIIVILSISCSDVLINSKEIEIRINKNMLIADNEDFSIVKLKFSSSLIKEQEVKISTTNGTLYSFPLTSFENGNKEIILTPVSDSTSFIIKSSNIVDENVILTITYNNINLYRSLIFNRSCPTNIYFNLLSDSIQISNNILNFESLLETKSGVVSKGNKFDLEIYDFKNDSLINTLIPVFLDSTSKNFDVKTKISKPGTYSIKITSDTEDCKVNYQQDFVFKVFE